MMRSIGRLATALAVPLTLLAAPAADAGVCVARNTFNFSPPLTLTTTSGTMSGTHTNVTCAFDTPGTVGISASYTGNCFVVLFGANTVSTVLGGFVHVMFDANRQYGKVMVTVPDNACPISSMSATGVWFDNT